MLQYPHKGGVNMQINTCFLVCPIGEEGTKTRRHSDEVYEHLVKHVCDLFGITVVRVDKICRTTEIIDDIYEHLINDDLVIVDITENNPNVFFELGYRKSLGKPLIIINDKDSATKFPFDIRGTRILGYSLMYSAMKHHREELYDYIQVYVLAPDIEEYAIVPATETESGLYATRRNNGNISINIKKNNH